MKPEAQLIQAAIDAQIHAHAPYSNYHVGAALLCEDGSIIYGCNVENASYGLTNCAERTAVFSAIAQGQRNFTALAISASGEATPFPCGACRQVLVEFCAPDFPVYIISQNDPEHVQCIPLGELLPHSFEL